MRSKKIHRARFVRIGLSLLALPLLAGAMMLGGCSGSFNDNLVNGDSGVFFSADQPVGNGVARSFVDLNNGIPVRLGMEFTAAALTGLPAVAPDEVAAPFLAPLPSKTHGTPFTNVVLAYAASHPATNEPEHFHLAFFIRALLVTVPPFPNEVAAVDSKEVPKDHVRVVNPANPAGVIIPGGGVFYDDTTVPSNFPPAATLGQNYIFLDGHMNGITVGPTIDFMKSKQSFSANIKQPEVHPRNGFYPTTWKVSFDAARNVHVIELTNFKRAAKLVPPGS